MEALNSRQVSTVRMLVAFFFHHLESLGVKAADLRLSAGLSEDWLGGKSGDELISLLPRLLLAGRDATGDGLIGLHAGHRFHFCLAGFDGLTAAYAPTPALALETMGRFVGAEDVLVSSVKGGSLETVISVDRVVDWPVEVRDQLVDSFVSCVSAALRVLTEEPLVPLRVRLRRERPAQPSEFERVLRCSVEFGAARDEVVFRTADLESDSIIYEPTLYEQLRFMSDIRAKEPSGSGPVRQLVEQVLRGGTYGMEGAALKLRMTPRTLQRRLQSEGCTFRSILNDVRVELAAQMLRGTQLSVRDIAHQLSYQDDNALRKAIKRETGHTPAELRDS